MAYLIEGTKLITVLGTAAKDISDMDWNGLGQKLSSLDVRAAAGVFSDVGRLTRQIVEKFGSDKVKKLMTEGTVPGTPIIDYTIYAITALELLAGFGTPDKGDTFTIGKGKFDLIHERLGSAFPDDRWLGDGAEAYAAQNTDQRNRAATMAGIDAMMADILKLEASQVIDLRRNMKITRDGLTACIAIALALKAIQPPDAGESLSIMFQLVVSLAALAAVVGFLGRMVEDSRTNADCVREAAASYREVQAAAVPKSASFNLAAIAEPGEARVGNFETLSGGVSGTSAKGASDAASGSAVPRADVEAGKTESPGDGEPVAAQGPSTPAPTMPTVAQLMAMSGQAAKPSGRTSRQQVASAGERSTPATAPTDESPPAADVEGAAVGAQAERAPIEATAAAGGHSQASDPAGRSGRTR
ncbi:MULTISPECIES: EspA/EspE family type VII secretion system effector [unclassified Mycobacterium]|uniref:EspA/EspE family type VII secretion system effector n=1 Tax=unclassified Mycobacterium TaxID=2642494 RepID=UPI00096E019A|nr:MULTISPECIES: EspA/EspE family type VII secretion system effector [unclassified Mycobacterium]OMC15308.1 hypothetical protein A5736_01625 [Mycobacterium sp. SP-6446]OMC54029.1 hypothetical protein A5747_17665 [Mycobacterium sp. IS-836]